MAGRISDNLGQRAAGLGVYLQVGGGGVREVGELTKCVGRGDAGGEAARPGR